MQDTLTIRIDTTLKQKAEKKAAEQDETVSQIYGAHWALLHYEALWPTIQVRQRQNACYSPCLGRGFAL